MSKRSSMYRDSRWQQKRLEIMERDNWTCRSCGASGEGVTLNVHHAYYDKGKKPWEYDNHLLVTWCEKCHKVRHEEMKEFQAWLTKQPMCVANSAWVLAHFDMKETCNTLEPGMPDEIVAAAIGVVTQAFYSGVEGECN